MRSVYLQVSIAASSAKLCGGISVRSTFRAKLLSWRRSCSDWWRRRSRRRRLSFLCTRRTKAFSSSLHVIGQLATTFGASRFVLFAVDGALHSSVRRHRDLAHRTTRSVLQSRLVKMQLAQHLVFVLVIRFQRHRAHSTSLISQLFVVRLLQAKEREEEEERRRRRRKQQSLHKAFVLRASNTA
jgi:hypothetical protein